MSIKNRKNKVSVDKHESASGSTSSTSSKERKAISVEELEVPTLQWFTQNRSQRREQAIQDPKKSWKTSRRLVFTLGTIVGILIACYMGADHVRNNNSELFDSLSILNMDSVRDLIVDWKEVLPQSVASFLGDMQNGYSSENNFPDLTESFAVGKQMRRELNMTAKHPVVMVPGVISTGIESWGVEGDSECESTPHFRKRLWGSFYMLRTMVLDKMCWLRHIMLDPITGLDPPHFRLRAAQGFEAADFFMAGYWIWNKILQNLGAIGYDPDTMTTAAYDWRLAYLDLERRDRFFTKLKQQIELIHELSGEKVCLVGHSMGSQIVFYFLKWAEAKGEYYGNGGEGWTDKHVDSFVNVAGTMLGAPKAVPALISGEMKDTIQLNALAMYGLEKFFSRKERLEMIQTWGGIPSMLPKGGDLIWGTLNSSVEDQLSNSTESLGSFIKFEKLQENARFTKNFTIEDSIDTIMQLSPWWLQDRINDQYTFGYAKTEQQLKANEKHHSHWSNPLEVPLPNAPDMKIYCIYGIHNPTERAYVYREQPTNSTLNLTIDYDSTNPVYFTEGDGTVPLITHSMCHKWAQGKSPYNPGGSNVTIVEIKHQPERFDMRGGAKSAEHVDILGSAELNEYLLRIASGNGDTIQPRLLSNLSRWAEQIPFPM
ncbi:phospholipid:diacylglycerol acyltransferase [Zygosaccharomyces mellis]|uniref:Phospholipid:diacylglycerol acyltransferase n=1 Tax=Zygosaccharomyces mellis TaxID=42258 RepID=A0A4C2E449_9SACH|nr:phospholipid:diacylglycerol acyltransferase [Zygosaccharomyces mellis]